MMASSLVVSTQQKYEITHDTFPYLDKNHTCENWIRETFAWTNIFTVEYIMLGTKIKYVIRMSAERKRCYYSL